jgi:AcrR family transcriptional regulator
MSRRSVVETSGPSLRERIRETTVQAILTAAEEVFAGQGLHAAHMGDIAARAGVAVGTLYNHFEDREALLAGLLGARRTELLGRLDAALRDAHDLDFVDRLRALLVVMLGHSQSHHQFFHILMQGEVGRYQQTFPSACRVPADTMREVFGRVDKLMKQGVREKILRPALADLAPVLFMGMVRALAIRAAVLKTPAEFVSEADRLLGFFLDGARA